MSESRLERATVSVAVARCRAHVQDLGTNSWTRVRSRISRLRRLLLLTMLLPLVPLPVWAQSFSHRD